MNYTNVAREADVNTKAVHEYFQVLEDTLLGFRLLPSRRSSNRRLIETEKFYLFDVGLANYLAKRTPQKGTFKFGKSFEHYILMELKAYQVYINPELPICFWRTSIGREVDFILGDMEVAIEIKASDKVHESATKGLLTLQEEHTLKHALLIFFESEVKTLPNGIVCFPWQVFLQRLWDRDVI